LRIDIYVSGSGGEGIKLGREGSRRANSSPTANCTVPSASGSLNTPELQTLRHCGREPGGRGSPSRRGGGGGALVSVTGVGGWGVDPFQSLAPTPVPVLGGSGGGVSTRRGDLMREVSICVLFMYYFIIIF